MDFAKDLNNIIQKSNRSLEQTVQEKTEQAKVVLAEVMGDQLDTITSITFDLDTGKFKDVSAPETSKELLRKANLLLE
ncbi:MULTISPECIES: hypothetical protein [Vibrio]|uniref:hypothetical protein n=1 Tax=Vibrio TaxID=662 RepID=UPI000C83EA13|nr:MULTISPECIES: hypothetical protein [Vibrio]PMI46079.1 hypothetical protein BCU44_09765 [Vibrio cyclitrophicus]PMP37987.1 hypothetical protein BCS86_22035 [Vibrio splendidus]